MPSGCFVTPLLSSGLFFPLTFIWFQMSAITNESEHDLSKQTTPTNSKQHMLLFCLLGPHSEAKQNRVWVETDTKSHIEHLIRNLRVTWTTTGLEPRILRGGTSVMRAESAERCTACAEMGKAAACAWEPSQVPCFTHLWRESSYLRDVVPIFHQQKTFGDQYNDEFSLQRAITPGQDDALIFFIDPVQTVL